MLDNLIEICSGCGRIKIIYDKRSLTCYDCYHKFSPYHLGKKTSNQEDNPDAQENQSDSIGHIFDCRF